MAEVASVFREIRLETMVYGHEIDIGIPSLEPGIEARGFYSHTSRVVHAEKKSAELRQDGIRLIRLHDEKLPSVTCDQPVSFRTVVQKHNVDRVFDAIQVLVPHLPTETLKAIRSYKRRHHCVDPDRFRGLCSLKALLSLANLLHTSTSRIAWQ